ncbi:hypothetical protein [Croceicoccus sp. BE223]|uniref:hypothetical protein n=1 Tax=Croceicoccus sp. BE223 TaxID=2817716 RepID=UPI00285BFD45|nr:hypothetical protein [Croceicoccus sp. BE223]MDR7101018.1 hypothetical protein [Croceicoccus sp. BE223]
MKTDVDAPLAPHPVDAASARPSAIRRARRVRPEPDPPRPPHPDRHPPRPRLTLNVGITGHRGNALDASIEDDLRHRLDTVLGALIGAVKALRESDPAVYSPQSPQMRFHTALATGADQIAAKAARGLDYEVRAVLPFSEAEYTRDFALGEENREFKRQVANADEVLCLPGKRAREDDAYVLVGKAIISASDILVAVWDGGEGRGRGGTAHVVEMAMMAGVPVLHIPVDCAAGTVGPSRLLVGGEMIDPVVEPIDAPSDYARLVRRTLCPHSEVEHEQLAEYFAEREIQTNWRIEYPLMLSLLGVKRMPPRPWHQGRVSDGHESRRHGEELDTRALDEAYDWANFLAIRYAQLFRSGHVTNYALAALAVIVALTGLIVPTIKIYLVMLELSIIGLLFYNTHIGGRGEWHRKWLQYRHLAESLRPLIYLKRTGLAGPPFRADFAEVAARHHENPDWTRWYATAIWREMEAPVGTMTEETVRRLAEDVLEEQVRPQAAYHKVNAERMHKIDHKLHEVGNFLVGAVIAACTLYIVIYFARHEWIKALTAPFIFVTAGFPALSAAAFGLRGHGEHLVTASRSHNTVRALAVNEARLEGISELDELTAELRNTAEIMLSDLNEWSLAYRERSLQVPG